MEWNEKRNTVKTFCAHSPVRRLDQLPAVIRQFVAFELAPRQKGLARWEVAEFESNLPNSPGVFLELVVGHGAAPDEAILDALRNQFPEMKVSGEYMWPLRHTH